MKGPDDGLAGRWGTHFVSKHGGRVGTTTCCAKARASDEGTVAIAELDKVEAKLNVLHGAIGGLSGLTEHRQAEPDDESVEKPKAKWGDGESPRSGSGCKVRGQVGCEAALAVACFEESEARKYRCERTSRTYRSTWGRATASRSSARESRCDQLTSVTGRSEQRPLGFKAGYVFRLDSELHLTWCAARDDEHSVFIDFALHTLVSS